MQPVGERAGGLGRGDDEHQQENDLKRVGQANRILNKKARIAPGLSVIARRAGDPLACAVRGLETRTARRSSNRHTCTHIGDLTKRSIDRSQLEKGSVNGSITSTMSSDAVKREHTALPALQTVCRGAHENS
ncbi:MAG: hypothetical protein DMF87_26810 [Acidobacteria bacterium]|nr:MAG: hypothetical protein DMF87_26810 [Acidobacteriota bacterium]